MFEGFKNKYKKWEEREDKKGNNGPTYNYRFGKRIWLAKAIAKNEHLSTVNRNREEEYLRLRDNPEGLNPKFPWYIYDSDLHEFDKRFRSAMHNVKDYDNYDFQTYLEEKLVGENGERKNLIGIEFGGSGSSFFGAIENGLFGKSIGVCLEDLRSPDKKGEDESRGHQVLKGDIFDGETYNKLKKLMGEKRASLIISKMEGPMNPDGINKHPIILDKVIRQWYSLLATNGMMFIQTTTYGDEYARNLISSWIQAVQEACPQIEIEIDPMEKKIIRIYKKPGSPEELPNLSQLLNLPNTPLKPHDEE